FGHTHIPLALPWGDVLLVNPGAIASGNYFTRQLLHSVARLLIDTAGAVWVEHCDLDRNNALFTPTLDLDAGFRAALELVSAPIADHEMLALWPHLRTLLEPLALSVAERELLHAALQQLALPYWQGAPGLITRQAVVSALRASADNALWAKVSPLLNVTGQNSRNWVTRIIYACPDPHGGATRLDRFGIGSVYGRRWPQVIVGTGRAESCALIIAFLRTDKFINATTMLPDFLALQAEGLGCRMAACLLWQS
ncbi:hypothetical protein HC891_13080, partial [Candidatus Gracilibacteria bacterium]|nr:hypothetical protein [Candidatus Gracilibacteria bacterium]